MNADARSTEGQPEERPGLLANLLVLEIAGTPGACFAGTLLADFGADVYVCEALPEGSPMRRLGPTVWWSVLARNKKSLALDLKSNAASATVRALLTRADMVVTDIAQPNWADDPWLHGLAHLPRRPAIVSVFPTGADRPELWPWSRRADLAAAATGLMALTGHSDGPPVQPECPLAEYLAGTLAALRAIADLRAARIARNVMSDVLVPLHQAALRMIEWQMPIATAAGRPELRVGNAFPLNAGIANMHLTRDGKYIAISAANQAAAGRLLEMVGGAALREDPRFATVDERSRTVGEIYKILDRWVGERSVDQVLAIADANDVVLGPIFATDDIVKDATIMARRNVVELQGADGTRIAMPSIVPRIAGLPTPALHPGPALGANTQDLATLCAELGPVRIS